MLPEGKLWDGASMSSTQVYLPFKRETSLGLRTFGKQYNPIEFNLGFDCIYYFQLRMSHARFPFVEVK